MDPSTPTPTIPGRRRMLALFVRAQRERLTPAAAGLETPPGQRRRTPGLRREEVAQLSGMSTTWITWLEQGREVSTSPHALARLARALNFSRAERDYLFELAGKRDPATSPPEAESSSLQSLAAVIEGVAGPAYVLDRCWNARVWNEAALDLFPAWLDRPDRNALRYMFLNPAARRQMVDWEERARHSVGEFRADFSRNPEHPEMKALLAEVRSASEFFLACWRAQSVVAPGAGVAVRLRRPGQKGIGEYRQFTFVPSEQPDFKLVMLSPAQR